jgi:hypothetical protein
MQVWGVQARERAWCVAVFGGFSSLLVVGLATVPALGAELSPAQVVAQRFPAAWAAGPSVPSNKAAVVSTRGVTPADSTRGVAAVESTRGATPVVSARAVPQQLSAVDLYFNPSPTSGPPSGSQPSTALAYAGPTPAPASASSQPSGYQLASATSAPERRVDPQRAAASRNNVFNDTQIASIKERLNLRPAQERMWPQVEAALRGLSYRNSAAGEKKTAALRTLDPASPEVARLKTAALPLVISFDGEQKRELRTLAHLIGLGNMVAQF